MTDAPKNFAAYATDKQSKRIAGLRHELEFRARIQEEIAKPIVAAFDKARLALAHAVEEIGVPVDGRIIHFKEETDERGPEGVYYETQDLVFDEKRAVWGPRPEAQKIPWIISMQQKGARIPLPLQGSSDTPPLPPGADPATHDLVPDPAVQ